MMGLTLAGSSSRDLRLTLGRTRCCDTGVGGPPEPRSRPPPLTGRLRKASTDTEATTDAVSEELDGIAIEWDPGGESTTWPLWGDSGEWWARERADVTLWTESMDPQATEQD